MKGEPLPDKDHVARYCGGARVKEDGSISGEAFRLKEKTGQPEKFLSVNWLEYLNKGTREEEINEIRDILSKKLPKGIGAKARIAVLNVGYLRGYVLTNSEDGRDLKVLHEPEEPDDPSHSGIHNLRMDDCLIADLIAQIIQEKYPAKAL